MTLLFEALICGEKITETEEELVRDCFNKYLKHNPDATMDQFLFVTQDMHAEFFNGDEHHQLSGMSTREDYLAFIETFVDQLAETETAS